VTKENVVYTSVLKYIISFSKSFSFANHFKGTFWYPSWFCWDYIDL